jgi:hypothetical protein
MPLITGSGRYLANDPGLSCWKLGPDDETGTISFKVDAGYPVNLLEAGVELGGRYWPASNLFAKVLERYVNRLAGFFGPGHDH